MSFDDIFISYGRKESKDFARKLHDQLMADGYEVWFDQEDIPLGVDFQDQIDEGITQAHNFVYVISPHAIDSEYCLKEVELAVKYKKRIIPILHVPARSVEQEAKIHPAIGRINWTSFEEGGDFEASYKNLLTIVKKNKVYVELHTEFLNKALVWKRNNLDSTYLLVGNDRKEAQDWLATDFEGEQAPCLPIDLQCELIAESKKNADNLFTDVYLCFTDDASEKAELLRLELIRRGITTWTRSRDLKSGMKSGFQIEQGIEQADAFIFFSDKVSLEDEDCMKQLAFADKLNKRLLPIALEKVPKKELPESLVDQNFIAYDSPNFRELVLADLHEEKAYYDQHTKILVAAIKWERQNYNQSILFRGFNLQEAENWLRISEKRTDNKPTELQQRFVTESSQKGGSIASEVFVSYSRADGDFARKLNGELQIHGKTTWFDQESIAPTADFEQEIFNGIKNSDNFLFVISPQSVKSPFCEREIAYAHELNKRFVPVLVSKTDEALIPEVLAKIQWIDFRIGSKDFHTAFSELLRTLDTDRDHVSAHTRWAIAAEKWNEGGRLEELLIRGVEYEMAKAWLNLALAERKSPAPTAYQEEFLDASSQAIVALEKKKKRSNRRLVIMTVVMALLAISSLFLAAWSFSLKNEAELAQEAATKSRSEILKKSEELEKQTNKAKAKQRDAELAGELARRNFKRAEEERERAEKEKKRAEANGKEAEAKTKEAQANLLRANENEELARTNLDKAIANEKEAKRLAQEAENRLNESQASAFIAKAREVENEDPTVAIHLALAAEKIVPEDMQVKSTIRSIYYKNNFYESFAELESAVKTIAFSKDKQYAAIATKDNTVEVWNAARDKVKVLEGHTGLVNTFVFHDDGVHLVTGSEDKTVRFWNLETGESTVVCTHISPISKVAVSSGKSVRIAVAAGGNRITIWTSDGSIFPFIGSHSARVTDLEFSPNNKYLLSGSADKSAILWRMSGKKKREFKRHLDVVNKVRFSPNGKYIATASEDRSSIVWNLKGGVVAYCTGHTLGVNDVVFSSDSKLLLTASEDKTARLWTLSGEELQRFKGHAEEVTSVSFSANEDFILTASADHSVKKWKVNTEEMKILTSLRTAPVAFAASNKGYIAISMGNEEISLLDDNAAPIRVLKGHKKKVSQLAFAPNGLSLVSADVGGEVRTWSLEGKMMTRFKVSGNEVTFLKVTPKGDSFIVGTREPKLSLWSFKGKKIVDFTTEKLIVDASIGGTSQQLLAVDIDGGVTLWGRENKVGVEVPRQQFGATACEFRKMENAFLVGYENGLIRQWDDKLNRIRLFGGHDHRISSLTVADDDRSFVSTSDDKTARLWDMRGNQLEFYSGHKDVVTHAAFNADGRTLVTSSVDKTVRRWKKSVSYEEFLATNGFSELSIGKKLEYGLLRYEELKKDTVAERLLEGANYYLSKAVSYDEKENLMYKQHSVVLLSRALSRDIVNLVLRKRLSEAYYELSWRYLVLKEFGKANSSARLAYDLLPGVNDLLVRYATCSLYHDRWTQAKGLYDEGMKDKAEYYGPEFIKEIERLESMGVYAKYRVQAKEMIQEY